MVVAVPPAGAVTFSYNTDGHRVRKETASETRKYIFDGRRLLLRTDGADDTEQLYTSTLEEFGNLVSQYDGSTSTYYQYDGLGCTDALLDDSGTVTDQYRYRAFGAIDTHSGSDPSPFTFVGQQNYQRDEEVELYFAGARYLDPHAGRWISEDPIGFRGGDVNLYRYVGNNPVNEVDPSGRKPRSTFRSRMKLRSMLDDLVKNGISKQAMEQVLDEFYDGFKQGFEAAAMDYVNLFRDVLVTMDDLEEVYSSWNPIGLNVFKNFVRLCRWRKDSRERVKLAEQRLMRKVEAAGDTARAVAGELRPENIARRGEQALRQLQVVMDSAQVTFEAINRTPSLSLITSSRLATAVPGGPSKDHVSEALAYVADNLPDEVIENLEFTVQHGATIFGRLVGDFTLELLVEFAAELVQSLATAGAAAAAAAAMVPRAYLRSFVRFKRFLRKSNPKLVDWYDAARAKRRQRRRGEAPGQELDGNAPKTPSGVVDKLTDAAGSTRTRVKVGGDVTLDRISAANAQKIQQFADEFNVEVTVVGSRVNAGKQLTPGQSDWDFVINKIEGVEPTRKLRDIKKKAGTQLPKGSQRTDEYGNVRRGSDIQTSEAIETSKPHVTFKPGGF